MWDDDPEKSERLANHINKLLGDVSLRRKLLRFLYICCGLNLIIWAAALLFPADLQSAFDRVHDASDKLSKIVLALPFSLGMAITYSLFRLKFPDIEEQKLDSDLMGSYAYQSHSQKRWLVWLFSTVGGILNLLLLIITTISLANDT